MRLISIDSEIHGIFFHGHCKTTRIGKANWSRPWLKVNWRRWLQISVVLAPSRRRKEKRRWALFLSLHSFSSLCAYQQKYRYSSVIQMDREGISIVDQLL